MNRLFRSYSIRARREVIRWAVEFLQYCAVFFAIGCGIGGIVVGFKVVSALVGAE